MLRNLNNNDKAGGDSFAGGQQARKTFIEDSVTIKPGRSASLGLGIYDSTEPTPAFELSMEEHTKQLITADLDRLDVPGTTRHLLLYRFRNNSQHDCHVTVRRKTEEVPANGILTHRRPVRAGAERV